MCLFLPKRFKKNIAKKDIIVYKHIIQMNDNSFRSSYFKQHISFNTLINSEIKFDRKDMSTIINDGLHSYKSKQYAKKEAKRFNELLVECIIPKGAIYYVAHQYTNLIFSISHIAYVSDKLIYKRIIKDYKD